MKQKKKKERWLQALGVLYAWPELRQRKYQNCALHTHIFLNEEHPCFKFFSSPRGFHYSDPVPQCFASFRQFPHLEYAAYALT